MVRSIRTWRLVKVCEYWRDDCWTVVNHYGINKKHFKIAENSFGIAENPFGIAENPFGIAENPFGTAETNLDWQKAICNCPKTIWTTEKHLELLKPVWTAEK